MARAIDMIPLNIQHSTFNIPRHLLTHSPRGNPKCESSHTFSPRRYVAFTTPCSVSPAYGVTAWRCSMILCVTRNVASGSKTMMSVGLHCRLAGRPGKLAGLERFLKHALGHQDVWFCRRIEIARHWRATHPHV